MNANAVVARDSASDLKPVPSGVRILVVDDDARIRRAVGTALSRAGFHVVTGADGQAALFAVQASPPDLAIVDYQMPTCGLELVRALKALHGAAIWVAVLSGHDDDETRAACFDAGVDDFIVKPTPITELRRRMLAAARSQQAYVEARLARERADRLLAYGTEAAAMLAHDLNNGLAVALGNMTYLCEVLAGADEDAMQALVGTTNALRRMSGLVANFVDIARFEDAAVKPQCVPTNLRLLIQSVIDVHGALPTRGIHLQVDCDPDLTGHLDPALIERVLHNLVGNALRYCNTDGSIRVSGRIRESLEDTAVELEVFNTGPVVPEPMREHLFGKYVKGSGGKRGLGLYFSRLACEAHGGSIVYSAEGGSKFVLRLPHR